MFDYIIQHEVDIVLTYTKSRYCENQDTNNDKNTDLQYVGKYTTSKS